MLWHTMGYSEVFGVRVDHSGELMLVSLLDLRRRVLARFTFLATFYVLLPSHQHLPGLLITVPPFLKLLVQILIPSGRLLRGRLRGNQKILGLHPTWPESSSTCDSAGAQMIET